MEALKQIANVAGYSGLYRILKPGRAGVIVESLDDKKAKTMMGPTARVSVLNDISIYVDDDSEEQSVSLSTVLLAINEKYGDELPVDPKGSNDQLADFMASVVPTYDRDRVRTTDIKKLVSWYGILRQFAPEVFEAPAEEAPEETAEIAETPEATEIAEAPVAETPKAEKTQEA
ncbi:hypothetical protein GO755_04345 [Spirosoma sp. HMF4905]|uniref:DUF5606 domain-containing protein n=1 Tax=Spirosoma arboris TaxID=2682092 RepID=A0A7K1S605_9BACT|nr:DUF5606 domain-containing protein [Spirosoma arboris]MVM29252.1 hypothetical protein [Spirosoma arboris]